MLLKATILQDGQVLFTSSLEGSKGVNTASEGNNNNQRTEVNFLKLRPELVTDRNIYDLVQVSSILESPLASLYHSLHSLYAPLLLRNSAYSDKLPTKLQQLLAGKRMIA